MKSWIIIFIGLVSTWHYMDMASENGFYSLFLPCIFLLFLLAAVVKIAIGLGPGSRYDGDGGGGSFGGFGGSDSGGGGDC